MAMRPSLTIPMSHVPKHRRWDESHLSFSIRPDPPLNRWLANLDPAPLSSFWCHLLSCCSNTEHMDTTRSFSFVRMGETSSSRSGKQENVHRKSISHLSRCIPSLARVHYVYVYIYIYLFENRVLWLCASIRPALKLKANLHVQRCRRDAFLRASIVYDRNIIHLEGHLATIQSITLVDLLCRKNRITICYCCQTSP